MTIGPVRLRGKRRAATDGYVRRDRVGNKPAAVVRSAESTGGDTIGTCGTTSRTRLPIAVFVVCRIPEPETDLQPEREEFI